MPTPYSIHYHFSQGFSVSAQAAYLQCTDFTSQDPALTGEDNANTSNSTLIAGLQRTSQVQTRLPIHLQNHSRSKNASRLDLTANHIEQQEKPRPKIYALLAGNLRKHDYIEQWKKVAQAIPYIAYSKF